MIKNLNDLLSFITLTVLLLYSFRFLVGHLFPETDSSSIVKVLSIMKHYDENEEE